MALLSDIQAQWEKDGPIDKSRLDDVLSEVPKLHSRYWGLYAAERQDFNKLFRAQKLLKRQRADWYLGRMSDDECRELGWEQWKQPLKILASQVDTYLDSDKLIQSLQAKLDEQELKLKFLEDTIKAINFRSNQIRTILDYMRFSRGEL